MHVATSLTCACFVLPAVPDQIDDVYNETAKCYEPAVQGIDSSRDTVSGVRNGTEYINVTLHWTYYRESIEDWCATGEFAVRFVTWVNVYEVPPFQTDPETNAYENNNFDWEDWQVVPRGHRSVTIPFLRKDLYYLFQVAVPKSNVNVHSIWYSNNAKRYSSKVTYYGEQSKWKQVLWT